MKKLAMIATAVAVTATGVLAGGHAGPFDAPVTARQSHMKLYGFNLYAIVGMAQGRSDYDAEVAQAAADSLVSLTQVNQMRYWPQGSDNSAIEGTKALPEIWQNFPDVMEKIGAVNEAALALQAVASDGLDAAGPAAIAANDACNACHRNYRARD